MQKLNKQQLPSDIVANLEYNMTDSMLVATKADGTQVEIMKTTSEEKFKETTSAIVASIGSPKSDNGDIPIIELIRTGEANYQLRQDAKHNNCSVYGTDAVTVDCSTWSFDDNAVRGYVFSAQAPFYRNKLINRIKLSILYPGLVRIAVVNSNVFKANSTWDSCLVKWLVVKFCAFTGLKEFDIEDLVVGDDEWIIYECKCGETGNCQIASNQTVKIGSKSYTGITTSGANPASAYDVMANGRLFKSNNLKTASARPAYTNRQRAKSSLMPSGWTDIGEDSDQEPDMEYANGDLNIGLYVKGPASDTHPFPLSENCIKASSIGNTTSVPWYFYKNQASLLNQKVYAVKLDIHTPGPISIAKIRIPYEITDGMTDLANVEIMEHYTHYFRTVGLNQWNLPKDIIIENENEYLAIQGWHVETPDTEDLVPTTGAFCYGNPDNIDYMGVDTMKCKYEKGDFYNLQQSTTDRTFLKIVADSTNCLNVDWVIRGECNSKLEGLTFSVQGDSISTYGGEINTIADGNTTNNSIYYPNSGAGQVNNREITWWGILARDKRMRLLRNDAWSGSKVSETTNNANSEAAASSTTRVNRLRNVTTPTVDSRFDYGYPALILSNIGTNDLSGNVSMGTMSRNSTTTTNTILGAFSAMCYRMKVAYPCAKIVHYLLPRGNTYTYANGSSITIQQLAEEFEKIAKSWGQYYISLSYFGRICPTNSSFYKSTGLISPVSQVSGVVDYLHPSASGMEAVAQAIGEYLESIY